MRHREPSDARPPVSEQERQADVYELPVATVAGTATGWQTCRSSLAPRDPKGAPPPRKVALSATGEVEWGYWRAELLVSSWIQVAGARPRKVEVPNGMILRVRRPAGSSSGATIQAIVSDGTPAAAGG